MKKLVVIVILFFFTLGCAVEPVQMEAEQTKVTEKQLRLPVWLSGTYEGIHTKKPLTVSETEVSVAFLDASYTFEVEDIEQEIHAEGRYTLITSDDTILIFNQTTQANEINMHFNELNLGWFRLIQPE